MNNLDRRNSVWCMKLVPKMRWSMSEGAMSDFEWWWRRWWWWWRWMILRVNRRMQMQQRMLQHSTVSFPPRLYAHAPLPERSRNILGGRRIYRTNDGGDSSASRDHTTDRCRAEMESAAKRRRTSTIRTDANLEPNASQSRGIVSQSIDQSIHTIIARPKVDERAGQLSLPRIGITNNRSRLWSEYTFLPAPKSKDRQCIFCQLTLPRFFSNESHLL